MMADLGSIGSGFPDGNLDSYRTYNNPRPTEEAGGKVLTSFAMFTPSEWQLTSIMPLYRIDTNGAITGRVYLDTVPLANQMIWLHHRPTGNKLRQAFTDSAGYFSIYGLEQTADVYYLTTIYGTTAKALNINVTPSTFVEVQLYTMTARRPLVLINGRITEAPDGTTWAVGVPSALGTYSANVGDGSNLSYTITHSLGTRDVIVETRDNNSPYGVVDVDWEATTTSAITITFQNAPTTNRYRVNIIAV